MLRRVLAGILICLTAAPLTAQQTAPPAIRVDSVQSARLASLGRLWGTVKYFHPYLVHRHVDWDGALVRAIPRVMASRSPAEYGAAVDGMLSALGDPSTRVEAGEASAGGTTAPDSVPVRLESGVLRVDVVSLARMTIADNAAAGRQQARIQPALDSATAVVLDLRGAHVDPAERDAAQEYVGWRLNAILAQALDSTLVLGSVRSRVHSGFAPQTGSTSGGYYSGLSTTEPGAIAGQNRRRIPVVALIDRGTGPVADVLAGLSASGRGFVVQVGDSPAEIGVATHTLTLADGVRVRVRTGETVAPNGRGGFTPDTIVAPAGFDPARMAMALARSPRRAALPAPPANAVRPQRDDPYASMTFPGFEHRLLALFRFWNTIEYFFPYRRLIDEPWTDVLPRYVPRFAANRDAADYQQTVRELVAEIQDSHGGVRGANALRERRGLALPPFAARFVEGKTIITHLLEPVPGLREGDEILAVDGEPIGRYRERIEAITAASTPQALQRNVHYDIGRGAQGSVIRLTVRGLDGATREAEATRSVISTDPRWDATLPTNRSTPVFGVLPGGIGYVDLQRLQGAQVDSMFRAIAGTRATIFDMRGYPNGTAWTIAPRLTTRRRIPAATFSRPLLDGRTLGDPDLAATASFSFVQHLPEPAGAPYLGKVVMLIDENAQSQSEHTALFFESATDVTFIGTPTAGANGDLTTVLLPGGLTATFSGHDVRHADGRQLQRLGIQPHIRVAPTIRGLVEKRDEVLEAAVRHVQGGNP